MLVCSSSVTLVKRLKLQLEAKEIPAVVPNSLYDSSRVRGQGQGSDSHLKLVLWQQIETCTSANGNTSIHVALVY